ncbi:MAG: PCRF domain-containing protein, partial [Desulfobaccales bacterium]
MLNSRLQKLESQFIDLEQRLSDPEVIRDQELYQKYSKEHAELNPLIQTFRRYRQAQKELQESQTMLKEETDEELKSLVRDEIQTLREEAASREEELRLLLLPKDPNDEKDVLLEIRAGTGG